MKVFIVPRDVESRDALLRCATGREFCETSVRAYFSSVHGGTCRVVRNRGDRVERYPEVLPCCMQQLVYVPHVFDAARDIVDHAKQHRVSHSGLPITLFTERVRFRDGEFDALYNSRLFARLVLTHPPERELVEPGGELQVAAP